MLESCAGRAPAFPQTLDGHPDPVDVNAKLLRAQLVVSQQPVGERFGGRKFARQLPQPGPVHRDAVSGQLLDQFRFAQAAAVREKWSTVCAQQFFEFWFVKNQLLVESVSGGFRKAHCPLRET